MPSQALVRPLADLRRDDLDVAGGKGANLGELRAAGFPVPGGFVVTTAAYSLVIDSAGLAPAADVARAPDAIPDVRAGIESLPVPDELRDQILTAYRELGGGPVAVRSSATAEDLPGAAFAGQQDTYLDVSGEAEMLQAVRRCWASLWTERAVAYRNARGVAHGTVRMAVVVQRMVDADWAGVLFTANPVTGARAETVIDASPGLGEAVVSGAVTPDHFVLGADAKVLERRPGKREVVLRAASGSAGRGEGERSSGVLSDSMLAALSRVGARIAAHFGRPQDIEWAYAGGTLWILQARPMTALPPRPRRVNGLRRTAAAVLAELLPIRPYPLDMTTWTTQGHGRILTRMVREIPGIRVDLRQMLPEREGVVEELVPPAPRPTLRTLTTPFRLRRRIARFSAERWTEDPRFARFEKEIEDLRAVDLATLPWPELVRMPRRALAVLDRFIDLRIDYLPGVGVSLLRLLAPLTLLGLRRQLSELLLGAETKTAAANRDLETIAAAVRADPAAAEAFDTLNDAELARAIAESAVFAAQRPAIQRYLHEYGHREVTSAFLMSQPTWGEDPRVLAGALRALVRRPETRAVVTDRIGEAERRLLSRRRVRLTRTGLHLARAARRARAGIAFREDTHFHAMRPMPILRAALLEAGARLVTAGVLAEPADVLHLRLGEVQSIGDPGALSPGRITALNEVVQQRRARRDELAGAPMISPATLRPGKSFRASRRNDRAVVSGTPAGGGIATGPVRILREPGAFGRLRPGDILVCPYTNPAWTPLFQVAAAVVVDSGGIASHAAIVAREYGIPAVMGTGNGTALLADGETVLVDGTRGSVRRAP